VFNLYVLGSSSDGNCIYVDCGDTKLLLDCGLSFKQTKSKLHELGVSLSGIDYVLITHEHADHIQCLKQLVENYNVKAIASRGTLSKTNIPEINKLYMSDRQEIRLNNLTIEAKKINHDALEPLCFLITNSVNEKMFYLTDCGLARYLRFKDCDIYIIEANFCLEQLELNYQTNKIHKVQYDRALSGMGHLSLEDSIEFLKNNIGGNTKEIVLSHLSPVNANRDSFRRRAIKKLSFNNIHIAEEGLNISYGINPQPF
jgi:phosphoribosyl 1,2-cyclic phosphodiesterase